MDEFAKKCLCDHRNPIVRLNLPAQKLFLAAKTEEERGLIDSHQEHLKTILEHLRVEKRSSRAQAVWLPDAKIAQVTKVVKNLVKFFGFQNKNGIFLYPEEMLFLIETNRLEVVCNGSTVSIEKAYEIAFKLTNVSLKRYRIYRKLALMGYKLVRVDQFDNRVSVKARKNDLKRVCDNEDDTVKAHANKKYRVAHNISEDDGSVEETNNLPEDDNLSQINIENVEATNSVSKDVEHVLDIFRGMSKIMPMCSSTEASSLKPDYYIYLPTNVKYIEPDFTLFICEGDIIDQKTFSSKLPSIYATCVDDVAYYKFINVNLPSI